MCCGWTRSALASCFHRLHRAGHVLWHVEIAAPNCILFPSPLPRSGEGRPSFQDVPGVRLESLARLFREKPSLRFRNFPERNGGEVYFVVNPPWVTNNPPGPVSKSLLVNPPGKTTPPLAPAITIPAPPLRSLRLGVLLPAVLRESITPRRTGRSEGIQRHFTFPFR